MLSRLGPLGLSVLALAASFVIVLSAGGVLAAAGVGGTGEQAPTPAPTGPRTPAPAPAGEDVVDVAVAVDQLGGDRTLEPIEGATFRRVTAPGGAGAEMSGGGRLLLCVTLPEGWTLPRATLRNWSEYRDGREPEPELCRAVRPGAEIRVRLERVR